MSTQKEQTQSPSDDEQLRDETTRRLIDKLQTAEALRVDKQYLQSYTLFQDALNGHAVRSPGDVDPRTTQYGVSEEMYLLIERIKEYLKASSAGQQADDNDDADDYVIDALGASLLTKRQLSWANAHAAAAATNAYRPYNDQEYLLTQAKSYLLVALNNVTRYSSADAWSWAQLGEVHRKLANLPAFYYRSGSLYVRNGLDDYLVGAICFLMALTLNPHFAWAKAHLGALLLNWRRYYPTRGKAIECTDAAFDLIQDAVEQQQYRSEWSTDYLSIAHFVKATYRMLLPGGLNPRRDVEKFPFDNDFFKKNLGEMLQKYEELRGSLAHQRRGLADPGDVTVATPSSPDTAAPGSPTRSLPASGAESKKAEDSWSFSNLSYPWPTIDLPRTDTKPQQETEGLEDFLQEFLISLYYTIVLWHYKPHLLAHPVQPGTMEMDMSYAMLYDLSALLPYAEENERRRLAEAILKLSIIGVKLPKQDRYLVHVFDISQLYFVIQTHYVGFILPLMKAEVKAAEAVVDDKSEALLGRPEPVKGKHKELMEKYKKLMRDSESLWWSAHKMCVFANRAVSMNSPLTEDKPPPIGYLNSALSVVLHMIKTCVILRLAAHMTRIESEKDPENIDLEELLRGEDGMYKVLDKYNLYLKIFKGNKTAEEVVEGLYKLHVERVGRVPDSDMVTAFEKKAFWILDPVWSFGREPTKDFIIRLKDFLNFKVDWFGSEAQAEDAKA